MQAAVKGYKLTLTVVGKVLLLGVKAGSFTSGGKDMQTRTPGLLQGVP